MIRKLLGEAITKLVVDVDPKFIQSTRFGLLPVLFEGISLDMQALGTRERGWTTVLRFSGNAIVELSLGKEGLYDRDPLSIILTWGESGLRKELDQSAQSGTIDASFVWMVDSMNDAIGDNGSVQGVHLIGSVNGYLAKKI